MAPSPVFQDYTKRKNYQEGIRECDKFLEKNPDDVQALTTKFQLLLVEKEDVKPTLDKIASLPRPELTYVFQIETAIVKSQKDVYPPPLSAGPVVNKLWDQSVKGMQSLAGQHDSAGLRYVRALKENRLQDVQHALILLKTLFPKNRATYMAHAAFTQLLSTSKDDLQSRLALMLARKAVNEKFDEDKTLDCRVPGQIFAIQGSREDLEKIKDRSFAKSKQVYDALRDLNGSANGASQEVQTVDPASTSTSDWLEVEVSNLGKTFSGLIKSGSASSTIKEFATNSIRLFRTSMASLLGVQQRLISESCFLAISALIRLFDQSQQQVYLLQAAYLSEQLLQHNPHIHEAKLVLIYLFVQLGLGTLAIKQFESLNIREIQFDTVAHVLFARLSSVYPHSFSIGKRETFDPIKRTTTAINVYNRYEDKLTEKLEDVINHGQTGMIFDLQELRDSTRTSYSRRQTLLEHRKIARLTNSNRHDHAYHGAAGPRVTANWTTTTDNRDFDECFNFGYNVEKVLHSPVPQTTTLLRNLAADTLWSFSSGEEPLVTDTPVLLQTLKSSLGSASDDELTAAEQISAFTIVDALLAHQDVAGLSPKAEIPATTSSDLLRSIQSIPADAVSSARDGLASTLHDHYTYLDVLKIVAAFVKKHAKGISNEKEISSTISRAVTALQKNAKAQKNNISPSSVKDMITKDVGGDIWKSGLNAFNGPDLTNFCDEVCKSAREGWDGVLRIKMP